MKLSPGKAASIISLILLLLFPNLLVLLGYTVNESIFLGIVAAISGGLIAGWSNMEEEEKEENSPTNADKSSIDENNSTPNSTSQADEASNDKELTPPKTEEAVPDATDLSKEVSNDYQPVKNVNYELKFIEKLVEENTKKNSDLPIKNNTNFKQSKKPASHNVPRKGVSLLSWLLMKEPESSKKRRR